jgi:hypothetical protein
VISDTKIVFYIHKQSPSSQKFSFTDTGDFQLFVMIGSTQTQVYPTYQYYHYPQYKCSTNNTNSPFIGSEGLKYRELVYKYTLDISQKRFDSLIKTQPVVRIFAQTKNLSPWATSGNVKHNVIYEPYHAWSAEINSKTMSKGDKSITFNNLNQRVFIRNEANYSNPALFTILRIQYLRNWYPWRPTYGEPVSSIVPISPTNIHTLAIAQLEGTPVHPNPTIKTSPLVFIATPSPGLLHFLIPPELLLPLLTWKQHPLHSRPHGTQKTLPAFGNTKAA